LPPVALTNRSSFITTYLKFQAAAGRRRNGFTIGISAVTAVHREVRKIIENETWLLMPIALAEVTQMVAVHFFQAVLARAMDRFYPEACR